MGGIRRKKKRRGWARRIALLLFIVLIAVPAALLFVFRFLPVPGTPQMLFSLLEGKGAHYSWSSSIAPVLGQTVIASEDQNFCAHHGFDWGQIDKALATHDRHP